MAGSRALVSRIAVAVVLLVGVAVALRGYLPGAPEPSGVRREPSVVSVALMPVLMFVSIVILLAGVLASRHRLPLARPAPDPDVEPWRPARIRSVVVFVLAVLALLLAIGAAVYFIGAARTPTEQAAEPPPPTVTETTTNRPPAREEPIGPDDAVRELTGTALLLTAGGAIALVVVAVSALTVVAVSSGRRHPAVESVADETSSRPETASLVKAAEAGLAAVIAPGQDPRTAIIACYVAMERGLSTARTAAPLASDTPMEVLARAFERGALHDASARELVALFEEARFSPHSMLEWHRMRAEQLVRIVLADLQGDPLPDTGEVPTVDAVLRSGSLSGRGSI